MLPVRTDHPIPKRLFFDAMKEVSQVEVRAPVNVTDVIVKDVAGTGADIVASRSVEVSNGSE